jgi:adenosine deaminase
MCSAIKYKRVVNSCVIYVLQGYEHDNFFYRDITDVRILVKLMVSLDRQEGKESASETVDVTVAAYHQNPKIIVGLDLSGDPLKGLVTDYLPVLTCGRNAGLKISIHCAEVCICRNSLTSQETI